MTACARRLRRAANPAARVTWQPDRLAVKAAGWFARLGRVWPRAAPAAAAASITNAATLSDPPDGSVRRARP